MKKTSIKREGLSRLNEVVNWLYKDQPFLTNLITSFIALFLLAVIKLTLTGFQQEIYSGYFENIVIVLLMSILILQTPFRFSGWGDIAMIFVGIACAGIFFYNTKIGRAHV